MPHLSGTRLVANQPCYLRTIFEDGLGPRKHLLLPGVDVRRVQAIVPGQLIDPGAVPVGRWSDLGLEGR